MSRGSWASAASPSSASRESSGPDSIGPALKGAFSGTYIANEGFTRESAEEILAAADADAVAFGRLFIANPDLPARFARGARRSTSSR